MFKSNVENKILKKDQQFIGPFSSFFITITKLMESKLDICKKYIYNHVK